MKNTYKIAVLFFILLLISAKSNAQIPPGYYYLAKDKKQVALKTALKESSSPQKVLDYGGGQEYTWEGFYHTDQRAENETGKIIDDMYSSQIRYFNGFNAIEGMHIEHSFPKSWWGGHVNYAYKDLFHLYPADGSTNSAKNNFPLGEVLNPSFDNGVSKIGANTFGNEYFALAFEPADEYKGDFARSYFYISTIYEDFDHLWNSPMMDNNTYPVWKQWALDLLIKWHKQDPVSEKERKRQEAVFQIQENRNPFIDYPDLVEYIWGSKTNESFPFPEETEAFLIFPRQGYQFDFGIILSSNTKTEKLFFQGANISANVNLALKQNSVFSLEKNSLSVQEISMGANVNLTFNPNTVGNSRDTIVISGGGLQTFEIPLVATSTNDFILLEPIEKTPVGGVLRWIENPDATNYLLSIYQGDKSAGDLVFSAYIEGSSYNKAVEIYNGTGKTIDLSKYSIKKQSNGADYFGWTHHLSGTLANGDSHLIVHSSCSNAELLQIADELTEAVMNFNGNDAVALYRDDLMIDIIGFADAGAEVFWGENLSLSRKSFVTHPVSKYNPEEWTVLPLDNFTVLGKHSMDFSDKTEYIIQNLNTGKENSYLVDILNPETSYTYTVTALVSSGNKSAANTMQLHTAKLEAPIILSATGINENYFYANWEEYPYAEAYLLDVFKSEGSQKTEIEGFDAIGSNGKPLPDGWTGTASGKYDTSASSGEKAPSIRLGNKEWLQTKTYPNPVSEFSFMYRFASSSSDSYFIVEALSNDNWIRVDSIAYKNTTKTYPEYFFSENENIKSLRITYTKVGSGYLAIDDVKAVYGDLSKVYIVQNKQINGTTERVEDLEANQTYYYNLRSTLYDAVSDFSETMSVFTEKGNSLEIIFDDKITITSHKDYISIKGLKGNELIALYSLTGTRLYLSKVSTNFHDIPLKENGIFIVLIQEENGKTKGRKIIK